MPDKHTEPRRLGQGGEALFSLEARAAVFLAEARPTVGLTGAEIHAIEARLLHAGSPAKRIRLVPVLVALAVLLACGTGMALMGRWKPTKTLPTVTPLTLSQRPPSPSAPHVEPSKAEATAQRAAPTQDQGAKPSPSPAIRRTTRQPTESPPPAALPSEDLQDVVSAEARSLARAVGRWRREGDAGSALRLLGDHDRQFPNGNLAVESRVARAEILLVLREYSQALSALDSLGLSTLPRRRELYTIRGELRARAGRCGDARADLAEVVRDSTSDDLGRRAVRALADCQR